MIAKVLQYLHDVKTAQNDHSDVSALEALVLSAFVSNPEPRSGYMLMQELGLSSGLIYNALWKLERDGRLVSYWADEHYPRRRFYELPDKISARGTVRASDELF